MGDIVWRRKIEESKGKLRPLIESWQDWPQGSKELIPVVEAGLPAYWRLQPLNENDQKEVEGTAVLGKFRGPCFFLDADSRNGYHYPGKVWESVMENAEFKQRLKDRLLYGLIGHEDGRVSEKDLREGIPSILCYDTYIIGKTGIQEFYVIDTEGCRRLRTYLGLCSKLGPSTRSLGSFAEGQRSQSGLECVDYRTFMYFNTDLVLETGFGQASIELVESHHNQIPKGDLPMPEFDLQKLYEKSEAGRETLQKQLTEALSTNARLETEMKSLKERPVAFLSGATDRDLETLKSVCERLSLRSLSDIGAILEKLSPEDATQVKAGVKLQEALTELADYRALGTPAALKENRDKDAAELAKYRDIGTPEEIISISEKSLKTLEELKAIGGTPAQIKEAMEKSATLIKDADTRTLTETAKTLSGRFGRPIEDIQEMLSDYQGDVKKVEDRLVKLVGGKKKDDLNESKKKGKKGKPDPKDLQLKVLIEGSPGERYNQSRKPLNETKTAVAGK